MTSTKLLRMTLATVVLVVTFSLARPWLELLGATEQVPTRRYIVVKVEVQSSGDPTPVQQALDTYAKQDWRFHSVTIGMGNSLLLVFEK